MYDKVNYKTSFLWFLGEFTINYLNDHKGANIFECISEFWKHCLTSLFWFVEDIIYFFATTKKFLIRNKGGKL